MRYCFCFCQLIVRVGLTQIPWRHGSQLSTSRFTGWWWLYNGVKCIHETLIVSSGFTETYHWPVTAIFHCLWKFVPTFSPLCNSTAIDIYIRRTLCMIGLKFSRNMFWEHSGCIDKMVCTLYSPMSHELPIVISRSWFNGFPEALHTLAESMIHHFFWDTAFLIWSYRKGSYYPFSKRKY